MRPLNLSFYESTEHMPTDAQNGKRFLLCWVGRQYEIMRWSSERRDFFGEQGDYLDDMVKSFEWAALPDGD